MERIKLSKAEKQVLRELHRGNNNIPNGIDNYTFVDAVLSLTDKRLIKSAVNGDKVMDCKLTAKGYAYIRSNPHLHNPVNWSAIAAIASIATAIATTLALFVACNNLEYG